VSAATEHLTPERMLDYARRALDPIDLLAADDHLIVCADCRSRIVDEEGLRATVTSLEREIRAALPSGPEHLPYDQVESLAEDRLRGAAREIAETHAETCASCRAEIADLKGFAAAFRESRRAAAAALVAAAARPGSAVASAGARAAAAAARTAAADGRPEAGAGELPLFAAEAATRRGARARWWVPRPAFVAAFAAVILLAAGGWALRGRHLALKEKVDELTRQNESLAGRAAEADTLRARLEQKAAAAPEPAVTIALKDRGGDVGLDGDGQLTGLDLLPVAEGRAVAAALRHAKVEVATVTASLALPAPAGDAGGPAPVSPAGTVVRAQRPTLSWDAITGVATYSVVVSDESGVVAARADNVRGHTWTVSRPLRRGATYTWRVAAGRMPASGAPIAAAAADVVPAGGAAADNARPAAPDGGSTTPSAAAFGLARFRVLDKDEAAALDRLLRSSGGSALAAGVFFARAGLLDDAEKELRAVLDANPDSPIAKSMVQSFLEERVRNNAPAGASR
jgi:hypothetical protein